MAIIAKNIGGNFEKAPVGNHVAICIRMSEIGTVVSEWDGQKKEQYKVRITWELPNKKTKINEKEVPFTIARTYTLSMHEKSSLRQILESWRGKGFSKKEAANFDISKLLGVPCLLQIIHKDATNGKTYANISSIATLPNGTEKPTAYYELIEFSYGNENKKEMFDKLPKYEQDMIAKTPEYITWQNSINVNFKLDEPLPVNEEEDDLPF